MNAKTGRDIAIANGHQPGMFRPERIGGKYVNRTRCQHGCGCYLYESFRGVYGDMLTTLCTKRHAAQTIYGAA